LDYWGLTGNSVGELVNELLTCVYQATENSGDITRNAAASLAQALEARYLQLNIAQQAHGYVELIANALGRPLTWEQDDLALQNIQARSRAPSVWLLANIHNALLLATSNRSEAALGYATMDGDTCGGLSPLAGIDKHFLRHWLRWLEHTGPLQVGPWPAVHVINAQQPTAELRPAHMLQTDEADLMPYEILNIIEKAAIRDRQTPQEIFYLLQSRYAQHETAQLVTWVVRFFRLWSRNQWKRERYAPSFHLDDENLDPKTWCRFPILSGGFERELAELTALVQRPTR
jgi:NAD+ synthase (glutamine-hydrolysing)